MCLCKIGIFFDSLPSQLDGKKEASKQASQWVGKKHWLTTEWSFISFPVCRNCQRVRTGLGRPGRRTAPPKKKFVEELKKDKFKSIFVNTEHISVFVWLQVILHGHASSWLLRCVDITTYKCQNRVIHHGGEKGQDAWVYHGQGPSAYSRASQSAKGTIRI